MTKEASPVRDAVPPVAPGVILAMAVCTGIAVANIYYNQPMLGVMKAAFPASTLTGLIPTATQLGYAAGLFLLVPLGDLLDRRRLIIAQFTALGATLVATALAPAPWFLLISSFLVGAASTVAQQIVPFAAVLAPAERRGRVVSKIMAGLLCGILFSRVLAGFVATHAGWREMFWLGLPMALAGAVIMAIALPRSQPAAAMRYGAALASMVALWRAEPLLRRATMVQAALFASFTAFWTVLAFDLQQPRFALNADAAGLFGLVGAVGVLAAPAAGRLADKRGPAPVIVTGALLTLVAWIGFGAWHVIAGLVAGVIVLDAGVQSAMISNQHTVFGLHPAARGRINTIFMTGIFLGGAVGSAGALAAWNHAGWPGVCALGGGLALISLATALIGRR